MRSKDAYNDEVMVLDDDGDDSIMMSIWIIISVDSVLYIVSFNLHYAHVIFVCLDSSSPFHR